MRDADYSAILCAESLWKSKGTKTKSPRPLCGTIAIHLLQETIIILRNEQLQYFSSLPSPPFTNSRGQLY